MWARAKYTSGRTLFSKQDSRVKQCKARRQYTNAEKRQINMLHQLSKLHLLRKASSTYDPRQEVQAEAAPVGNLAEVLHNMFDSA